VCEAQRAFEPSQTALDLAEQHAQPRTGVLVAELVGALQQLQQCSSRPTVLMSCERRLRMGMRSPRRSYAAGSSSRNAATSASYKPR
jgi:hypothetical protein